MVGMFGAEMAVYFSPKDLGLRAENSILFSNSPDWIYGLSLGSSELSSCVCFGHFRDELSDC